MTMSNTEKEQQHSLRMQRKKEIKDHNITTSSQEKGVLIINTGNGKGKSSAAFGMMARALGHNMRVGVVQFIKGSFSTGEEVFFSRIPDVDFFVMGEAYTWVTQNREKDIKKANKAWDKAVSMMSDDTYQLIILDELNIALKHNYISLDKVITALKNRPKMQHVVITGRGAPQELIDIADTVTEMKMVKHAFKAGIKAQKGVEI
jgi:cob(I)alamin adenosyltransferase